MILSYFNGNTLIMSTIEKYLKLLNLSELPDNTNTLRHARNKAFQSIEPKNTNNLNLIFSQDKMANEIQKAYHFLLLRTRNHHIPKQN